MRKTDNNNNNKKGHFHLSYMDQTPLYCVMDQILIK